jgi:hypothetical protein
MQERRKISKQFYNLNQHKINQEKGLPMDLPYLVGCGGTLQFCPNIKHLNFS